MQATMKFMMNSDSGCMMGNGMAMHQGMAGGPGGYLHGGKGNVMQMMMQQMMQHQEAMQSGNK